MRASTALVLAMVAACGRPLDRKRVHADLAQLASIAAETRLALEEHPHASFRDEHLHDLRDKLHELRDELGHGTDDPRLMPAVSTARALVDEIDRERDPARLAELSLRIGHLANEVTP